MSLRGCILDKFIKLNDQLFDSVSCQSFFSLFTLLLEKAIISKKLIVSEFWRSMKFRSQFIRSLTTLNSFSYNFSISSSHLQYQDQNLQELIGIFPKSFEIYNSLCTFFNITIEIIHHIKQSFKRIFFLWLKIELTNFIIELSIQKS